MAKNEPNRQQLKERLVELDNEKQALKMECFNLKAEMVDRDRRVAGLEERMNDLATVKEYQRDTNQALNVYHAFTSGQISQSGKSLLLMHLIAADPKVFLGAARKAGLGDLFLKLTGDLEDLEGRVLVELRNDRKIPAIKLYREATSFGLKKAKDVVEAIGERNGIPRTPHW